MDESAYPALFRSSDTASNAFQKRYLRLIKAEYALLFVAAIVSMNTVASPALYALAAFILGISGVVLLIRSIGKPEQDWYKSRALAESVKTLTWRYAMCAHPFHSEDVAVAKGEFKENLERVFGSNAEIAAKIAEDWSAGDQITSEMDRLRRLPLSERKSYYEKQRIQEQQNWYSRKAKFNRREATKWVVASVAAYLAAAALSLLRIAYPDWGFWPIEPLIVVSTSIIGWMQIKKYNELAAAYSVTAHEIGMIKITLEAATEVNSFSDFVNEAEIAFSREHTLWIARQAN